MQFMNFSYDFPNCSLGTKDKRFPKSVPEQAVVASLQCDSMLLLVSMETQIVRYEEDKNQI